MDITSKGSAYLAWDVTQEVQKHFGIAGTERLRLIPPDHRYFYADSGGCRIIINGENTGSESIHVNFDFEANRAEFTAPSIQSLVRADRMMDFDMTIIDQDQLAPDNSVKMQVVLTDEMLSRIPIWEALPTPPLNDPPNRPPTVVGGP